LPTQERLSESQLIDIAEHWANDGSFQPDTAITRLEMLVMIARTLGIDLNSNDAASIFVDDDLIPSWARGAVNAVAEYGILQGKNNNYLAPNDRATRAEAVTMILRLLKK